MSTTMKLYWKKILTGILLLALVLAGEPGGVTAQAASAKVQISAMGDLWDDATEPPSPAEPQEPIFSHISGMACSYTNTSITLTWLSNGNNTGFHIYRKCSYDKDFKLLGTVANEQYAQLSFKDSTFVKGIRFTYRILPYHRDETTGEESEFTRYLQGTCMYRIAPVEVKSSRRSGNTKATIKWKKVAGVKGYEIYRKDGKNKYKRVKRIGNANTVKWTASKLGKSAVYFKVRAYVKYNGKYVYGDFSDTSTVVSLTDTKIQKKFISLQKKYPDGMYWNHKGKTKWDSTTVTNKPCVHYNVVASSCNHYNCPNGVIGYQCYGFAWKMSDLIYGRKAKIKNFRSFSKSRMGDVIRYSGHSVIITEKHSDYVVVGECNAGNTCIISWGRKVYKWELAGALYSRRYK